MLQSMFHLGLDSRGKKKKKKKGRYIIFAIDPFAKSPFPQLFLMLTNFNQI